jgi:hypothetical protein
VLPVAISVEIASFAFAGSTLMKMGGKLVLLIAMTKSDNYSKIFIIMIFRKEKSL